MDKEFNLSAAISCNHSTRSNHSNGSNLCNDSMADMAEIPEESKVQLYVVVAMLCLFSIIGTIGNATSFYIYLKRRGKSTSVIFILALAGTDYLTCLVIVPFTIAFELSVYQLPYDFMCKLYMFLITSNIPFSAYIMTAIAFDRYFCICHPFLHVFTVRRAKIIVCCLACLAFTFGLITALSYGHRAELEKTMAVELYEDDYTQNMTNQTIDMMYNVNESVANEEDMSLIEEYPATMCLQTGFLVSTDILNTYFQKIYTASYIVAFVIVVVLYCLIYRSILMRRAKKAKRKKNNYTSVSVTEPSPPRTVTTSLNGNSDNKKIEKAEKDKKSKRPSNVKDTTLYANIKTALMLFVVTIVFVIAFLPSFLMALEMLPFNMIIFYMYFSYNVANPIIYAFMNQTFREDLKNIIQVCK